MPVKKLGSQSHFQATTPTLHYMYEGFGVEFGPPESIRHHRNEITLRQICTNVTIHAKKEMRSKKYIFENILTFRVCFEITQIGCNIDMLYFEKE